MLDSVLNNSCAKAIIRLLPNGFKKYGIPRGIESYKKLSPIIIYPGSINKSISPKTISQEIHPKFLQLWLSKPSNESFILCLDEGISSSYGTNLTKNGKVIAEVSTYTGLKFTDIKKHKVFNEVGITNKAEKYKSSIATIATSGQHNYYHWLFNALPKIHLLDKSGIKYDKIYVEVKNNGSPKQVRI